MEAVLLGAKLKDLVENALSYSLQECKPGSQFLWDFDHLEQQTVKQLSHIVRIARPEPSLIFHVPRSIGPGDSVWAPGRLAGRSSAPLLQDMEGLPAQT